MKIQADKPETMTQEIAQIGVALFPRHDHCQFLDHITRSFLCVNFGLQILSSGSHGDRSESEPVEIMGGIP